jgi:hypothetical protein
VPASSDGRRPVTCRVVLVLSSAGPLPVGCQCPSTHHWHCIMMACRCQLRHTVGGLEASLEIRVVNRGSVPLLGGGGLAGTFMSGTCGFTPERPSPKHIIEEQFGDRAQVLRSALSAAWPRSGLQVG